MFSAVNKEEWLSPMREAALSAINIAATQMDDPEAATLWTEQGHEIDFSRPDTAKAELYFSRPDIMGEAPYTGTSAMSFDYLAYLPRHSRQNPIFDRSVRQAVLTQVRGRAREAEIRRLSPGVFNPAWALSIDILSWCALRHFLTQAEAEAIFSEIPDGPDGADDLPTGTVDRQWLPYGTQDTGLAYCHLSPSIGMISADGVGFRMGPSGSPFVRIENDVRQRHIHIEIHGCALPENALIDAIGRPLRKLLDDPALQLATERMIVKSASNHMQNGEPLVSIICDEIRVRCGAAPDGATFAWETMRDTVAEYPIRPIILPHRYCEQAWERKRSTR